jgi:hypothetical protein
MDNIKTEFDKLDDFDKLDLLKELLETINDDDVYELIIDMFDSKYQKIKDLGIKAYKNSDLDKYLEYCKLGENYKEITSFFENI